MNEKITKNLLESHPEIAAQWHPTFNGDKLPVNFTHGSNVKIWWLGKCRHEWQTTVNSRTNAGSNCPYCAGKRVDNDNCFAINFPEISSQWNYDKNLNLTPLEVTSFSNKKVWWICDKGHEWETSVNSRTNGGSKCPYCCNQKACIDNCLVTINPKLSSEWHPTKNGNLTPFDVVSGSNKKCWWVGSQCKHEWEASVYHRNKGSGCPYCDGKKVYEGNCFSIIYPELAAEWHPTKNIDKYPNQFTKASKTKVWWICDKGHEYESAISNRTNMKSGCPYCSGYKVSNENCLGILFPELLKEWHPTKNEKLTPYDFSFGSNKIVWWFCEKHNHEWQASVNVRSSKKHGCSYCSNRLVCSENCLATKFSELVKSWHPTKNDLTAFDVVPSSDIKVWWICDKGHEWNAAIYSRCSGNGCPYCSNKKVCIDNCLAVTHPEIAKQWHPTLNGNLTPNDVTYGLSKKIWWICDKGHEFDSEIKKRTESNSQSKHCPYCSNQKVCLDNCLATITPHLLDEWDYEKNKEFNPFEICSKSNKKVWWICENGHEWLTSPNARNGEMKSDCPYCNESKGEKAVCKILNLLKIDFVRQYKSDKCKNKRALPFDFCILSDKTLLGLIEYQGKQHYEPVDLFGGKYQFELQKLNDQIKLNYCIKNNIKLLIIPYWELRNLQPMVEDFVKQCQNINISKVL